VVRWGHCWTAVAAAVAMVSLTAVVVFRWGVAMVVVTVVVMEH
jgi:hypothetical protein